MIHLESFEPKVSFAAREGFPYSVPVIRQLGRIELDRPVTFFVGENGSGKSTLLECLALATRLPIVGAQDGARDPTLAAQRDLAGKLTLSWKRRTHRGFFLRAEDFFGFQKRVAQERADLVTRSAEIDLEYADRSAFARGLAQGPIAGSLQALDERYGKNPDARSHGEAFLHLFRARLVPGSLVLLDEPEAALSPQNQLGLIAIVRAMVEQECQFVIATHSPMLLATPGAKILSFDQGTVTEVAYQDLDHVRITRDFLNDPDRFLRQL